MKTIDETTRQTDEQIVAQYAESLQVEFERIESVESAAPSTEDVQNEFKTQIVAPWDGRTPLHNSDFFRVKYNELNAARFSFWIGEPPTTPYFAVIFEASNETVILKARVIESNLDISQGSTRYLVATEFSGKIDTQDDMFPKSN